MHLTLHLTEACNMRCAYCYAPPRASSGMTSETAHQALAFGARVTKGSCGIVFFGGEPLLQLERMVDVVERASWMESRGEGRFHFKVTTNGLLLDDRFLTFATQHDILVAMSFDGTREAHDRHRRLADGSPSYDVLSSKLDLLLQVRPYASVMLVVNPDTAEQLCDSVAMLLERGCRYVVMSLNYAADWTESSMEALRLQYEELAERYLAWTREGRKFYLSPFEVKIASHVDGKGYRRDRCALGERQLSIDSAGFLYPCVQFTRAGPESSWCIGHVSTGIDEEAHRRLRENARRDPPGCADCAIRERCNHTCGCLNWQATGQVDAVSPVLCRHEQMLLPIADRVGALLFKERNPHFLHKHYNPAYPVISLLEDTSVVR